MTPEKIDSTMAGAAAALVRKLDSSLPGALDYSEASLGTLDGVIDRLWALQPAPSIDIWQPIVAAYVGEVIRRNLGGRWVVDKQLGLLAIERNGQRVYPDNRIQKRLVEGAKWNLVAFFAELASVWREGETPEARGWKRRNPPALN